MGIKQVIVVRKDLNMRKGKIAAQVAHASMSFITKSIDGPNEDGVLTVDLSDVELKWMDNGFTKIVVSVDSEVDLLHLIKLAGNKRVNVSPIIDAGKTEFKGVPTLTCAAFGPDEDSIIDAITGGLKLL